MHNLCRGFRAAAACLAALLACGPLIGCAPSDPARDGQTTVRVASVYGSVSVPGPVRTVWALDTGVALELLALGVRPTHAGRSVYDGDPGYQARKRILTDAGVKLVPEDRTEAIIRARPDLVVGSSSPTSRQTFDKVDDITPTLIVDGNAPWDESLAALGKATGRQQQAQRIIRRLRTEVADTRAAVERAGFGGEQVSMISACGPGTYCSYGNRRAAGNVLTALGFTRPAAQDRLGNPYGFSYVSAEKLGELGAPIVIVLSGSVQFGAESPLQNPLLDTSDSVTGEVDFSVWFGSGAFDVTWILNDLRAILLDEGKIATRDDGRRLFDRMTGRR